METGSTIFVSERTHGSPYPSPSTEKYIKDTLKPYH